MSPGGGDEQGAPGGALLVSACLLGEPCRYDGQGKPSIPVLALVAERRAQGRVVRAVCPEELGGMGTPRPPAQLHGGDGHAVLDGVGTVKRTADGEDVTAAFLDGAHAAADVDGPIDQAILKARSPSCGRGATWIDGQLREGDGVFAALLRRRGVRVQTDEEIMGD